MENGGADGDQSPWCIRRKPGVLLLFGAAPQIGQRHCRQILSSISSSVCGQVWQALVRQPCKQWLGILRPVLAADGEQIGRLPRDGYFGAGLVFIHENEPYVDLCRARRMVMASATPAEGFRPSSELAQNSARPRWNEGPVNSRRN
jgi:hypothetical protein